MREMRKLTLAALLALAGLASTSPAGAAPCAGSQMNGSVFHDYDANGARSVGNVENGIAGAVVTAFSNDGSSASCETLASGSFGLDAPSGGFPVRVEVTLPAGPAFAHLKPGAAGLTNTFFVTGPTSGLDVGFNVPLDYCQANPDVMTTCFRHGNPLSAGSLAATGEALFAIDYDRTASLAALAIGSEVGAVWGLAYQRSSQSLFAAAALRRHAGFGPLGMGGIYKIDLSSGSPVVSNFVDLATLGAAIGTNPRTLPGENPPGTGPTGNEPGLDNKTYEEIGKVGLGDVDVEEEAGRLWVMSLGDRKLYALNIGANGTAPASATAYSLPAVTCTDGVFRPWAVSSHLGRIYIGGVCSNENISPYPAPPGNGFNNYPNLVGYVYSMDPANGVFSLDLTIPLNYHKGCAGLGVGCQWNPWTNLSTSTQVGFSGNIAGHPTPILSDIEFADDGDMIIGFSDRSGFQYGVQAPAPNTTPTNTSIGQVFAGGDMLRADFNSGTGAFTLESNGIVGGVVGAGSGNNEGPGGGEYYSASTLGFHFELSVGGYAVLHGSNHFVGSSMDPVTINSGGLLWMFDQGATPGARFAGYTLYANAGPPTFAKGVGIGDVELRCEEAPIEIGNRVWCDSNNGQVLGDGIQGPGVPDAPLSGVAVNLSCNGGAVTASTVTAADGTYLFGPGNVAGGIPKGATCTVSIDTTQAALGSCNLPTLAHHGGAGAGSTLRDSDGTDADHNGVVEATVVAGGPGANDHSIDFGFTVQPAFGSASGTVWCDVQHNSTYNPGEGINGVTMELFNDVNCDNVADGVPIASQVTMGDGQYSFMNLPLGLAGSPLCYVVRSNPALSASAIATCNRPFTMVEYPIRLDVTTPAAPGNDIGLSNVADIPALSEWGLLSLALLLSAVGFAVLRRR